MAIGKRLKAGYANIDRNKFYSLDEAVAPDGSVRPGYTAIIDALTPGGIDDAMDMYVNFRGKQPSIDPLLENRGLK